jgi:uncharacterized protein (TIGR00251 family)
VGTLAIHVTTKAGKGEIVGWKGSELAVRVTAAPDAGRANAAVCKLIAEKLGVPKTAVRIVRGHTARHKLLEIDGTDEEQISREFGRV